MYERAAVFAQSGILFATETPLIFYIHQTPGAAAGLVGYAAELAYLYAPLLREVSWRDRIGRMHCEQISVPLFTWISVCVCFR